MPGSLCLESTIIKVIMSLAILQQEAKLHFSYISFTKEELYHIYLCL